VRYSADGSRVITASTDRDARIWDPRTGASLVTLSGHFGRVSDASFSRDGRWAVTAGPASAGIWDARTGELLSYLRGHEGPVVSAVFAPDGRTVLTAGSDRTLRSWRCAYCGPLDELVGQARAKLRAVHRSLTPAERAENGL
jgi:WD40 repeat protein